MRDAIAKAAKDLAAHLQLIEHVKALQEGQKLLADGVKALGDRLGALEGSMLVLKAEIRLEALREVQATVNTVQGGLNERIETLAVKVAILQRDVGSGSITLNAAKAGDRPRVLAAGDALTQDDPPETTSLPPPTRPS